MRDKSGKWYVMQSDWEQKPAQHARHGLVPMPQSLCLRAEDQKLSCPESHSSCHNAAGDELSAKKQVVKMAPTVKPTPITISAVSPCSSVSGRLSTKRRFAIDWISLLTFCQSNQLSGNRPFHSSTE